MVFVDGWVRCDAVARAGFGSAFPFLDLTLRVLAYLLFSLFGCGGGHFGGANHAKVDGTRLKLVIVQPDDDVPRADGWEGGRDVGGLVEHVLRARQDGGVHGDILKDVE